MKKYVTKVWFKGSQRPKKLPQGCKVYVEIRTPPWEKETADPSAWETIPRCWREKVKTCKWARKNGYFYHPHKEKFCMMFKPNCCPTCGKSVEIVNPNKKETLC